jgi:polysaccharide pyruvyl transferase WcaK-like protein
MIRIGLWGTFDVENYGDALFPRLARSELARRLPGSTISTFGLVGDRSSNRFEAQGPIEPLGAPTPERLVELASRLDLVVVGGGEIVHTRDSEWAAYYPISADRAVAIAPSRFFIDGLGQELEVDCPVVWHAVGLPFDVEPREAGRFRRALAARPHVSVRDTGSLARLRAAGIDREIAVVPDPAIFLPRLLPPDVLAERIEPLRKEGSYPAEGRVLAVQGSGAHLPYTTELAAAIGELCERLGAVPLIVETGPCHGDAEFAEALARTLPASTRLGPGGLVDVTAAIAGSLGFVGVSLHGNIAAMAYGRPHLMLGMNGESKLAGLAETVGEPDLVVRAPRDVPDAFMAAARKAPPAERIRELGERADAQFDAIAEVARRASEGRKARGIHAASDRDALLEAFRSRGRRLVTQRWRLADRLAETEKDLAAAEEEGARLGGEVARLEERERELEAEVSGKQGELDRLMATRTFRYTAALRRAYGRIRSMFVRR